MFDPEGFVRFCQKARTAKDAPAIIHAELLRIVAAPPEIAVPRIGDFRASRLHRSPTLTVLHTAYPPSTRTPPHNHGTWAVVSVYRGREDNVVYERAGRSLTATGRESMHAGEAVRLDTDAIHDLSTCANEPTCSIHVYGADLYDSTNHSMWLPPLLEEEPYQEALFFRAAREMMRAV
jgi:predicted metal-dependent enzyme (double-stranded beta helix superfamily)